MSAIGRKHSAATIEKIRSSNKGKIVSLERRLKISSSLKGIKHSEERTAKAKTKIIPAIVRAKMSASHKARHAADPSLAIRGANARWGNDYTKEPLILTQPPIIISSIRN